MKTQQEKKSPEQMRLCRREKKEKKRNPKASMVVVLFSHGFSCSPNLPLPSAASLRNIIYPRPGAPARGSGSCPDRRGCESGVYRVRWNGVGWARAWFVAVGEPEFFWGGCRPVRTFALHCWSFLRDYGIVVGGCRGRRESCRFLASFLLLLLDLDVLAEPGETFEDAWIEIVSTAAYF
jgi:hypothetical protein